MSTSLAFKVIVWRSSPDPQDRDVPAAVSGISWDTVDIAAGGFGGLLGDGYGGCLSFRRSRQYRHSGLRVAAATFRIPRILIQQESV